MPASKQQAVSLSLNVPMWPMVGCHHASRQAASSIPVTECAYVAHGWVPSCQQTSMNQPQCHWMCLCGPWLGDIMLAGKQQAVSLSLNVPMWPMVGCHHASRQAASSLPVTECAYVAHGWVTSCYQASSKQSPCHWMCLCGHWFGSIMPADKQKSASISLNVPMWPMVGCHHASRQAAGSLPINMSIQECAYVPRIMLADMKKINLQWNSIPLLSTHYNLVSGHDLFLIMKNSETVINCQTTLGHFILKTCKTLHGSFVFFLAFTATYRNWLVIEGISLHYYAHL